MTEVAADNTAMAPMLAGPRLVRGVLQGLAGRWRANATSAQSGSDHRQPGEGAPFQPVRICDVDVCEPLPHIVAGNGTNGRRYGSAHIVVRLDTEPLGLVEFAMDADGMPPARLAELIWSKLGPVIADRIRAAGQPTPQTLPVEGIPLPSASPYRQQRAAVLATAPPISVVLCTRDPDEHIVACLEALDRQEYPDYEIVVVDNAPTSDRLARLLAAWSASVPVRRVVEPRPGVSWARNAGWRAATGRVVAYIDDDEVADVHWLAEIARGFRSRDDVRAVAGMILPAALETRAQEWFEQFGGHSKGRGFTPRVFDSASHAVQHPLYPLPPFGATGNLAIEREVLAQVGGFDVALGSGTPARGSEDTALVCDVMLDGHTLVYQPSAMVRHHHYEQWSGIANQLYGYGMGLTAFYTHEVLRDPRRLLVLARLAPVAIRDLFGSTSPRTELWRADYPAALDRLQRRGMLFGPPAYLHSRWRQRRVARMSLPGGA